MSGLWKKMFTQCRIFSSHAAKIFTVKSHFNPPPPPVIYNVRSLFQLLQIQMDEWKPQKINEAFILAKIVHPIPDIQGKTCQTFDIQNYTGQFF